ncbi:MAG: caspase family protein [Alphaproteobacteria bacterium]|nr:caspase family protein [Alphaproteobacteria bacterium]
MGRHALLIGVSEFADKRLARLNAPANDVLALREILHDRARGDFDTVELSLNADFVAMRDHLSHFFTDRAPDDLLLLYYSGHGILGRGNRLFLATTGSNLDLPRDRSISAQEIREFVAECRAERQIIILDCCHSGAFAEHAKSAALAPAVTAETFSSADAGLYVLTAADALQFAWDGPDLRAGGETASGNSLFTSWLVEGLETGAAAPDDEEITIDALYRYLFRRARAAGAPSTPQRFVQGGIGDLIVSMNPLAGSGQLDPDTVAALASDDRRLRLGAVTELAQLLRESGTTMRPARLALQRRLPYERDFAVRAAISEALQGTPTANAATGAQPQHPEIPPASDQTTAAAPRDRTAQLAPARQRDNGVQQTKPVRSLWLVGGAIAVLFVIGVFWAILRPSPTPTVSTHYPPPREVPTAPRMPTAPGPHLGSWSSTPVNPTPVLRQPKAANTANGGEQYPAAVGPSYSPASPDQRKEMYNDVVNSINDKQNENAAGIIKSIGR